MSASPANRLTEARQRFSRGLAFARDVARAARRDHGALWLPPTSVRPPDPRALAFKRRVEALSERVAAAERLQADMRGRPPAEELAMLLRYDLAGLVAAAQALGAELALPPAQGEPGPPGTRAQLVAPPAAPGSDSGARAASPPAGPRPAAVPPASQPRSAPAAASSQAPTQPPSGPPPAPSSPFTPQPRSAQPAPSAPPPPPGPAPAAPRATAPLPPGGIRAVGEIPLPPRSAVRGLGQPAPGRSAPGRSAAAVQAAEAARRAVAAARPATSAAPVTGLLRRWTAPPDDPAAGRPADLAQAATRPSPPSASDGLRQAFAAAYKLAGGVLAYVSPRLALLRVALAATGLPQRLRAMAEIEERLHDECVAARVPADQLGWMPPLVATLHADRTAAIRVHVALTQWDEARALHRLADEIAARLGADPHAPAARALGEFDLGRYRAAIFPISHLHLQFAGKPWLRELFPASA